MTRMEQEQQTATLIHRGKRHTVRAGTTLRDAIAKAGFSPEAVLASRGGELVTDDVILHPGEEIRLIAVISGG
jgi:sulfur carrier protein ThiS